MTSPVNTYVKTCVNRFLRLCEDCTEDYNTDHHPNNTDCPRYKEIELIIIEVKELDIIE